MHACITHPFRPMDASHNPPTHSPTHPPTHPPHGQAEQQASKRHSSHRKQKKKGGTPSTQPELGWYGGQAGVPPCGGASPVRATSTLIPTPPKVSTREEVGGWVN